MVIRCVDCIIKASVICNDRFVKVADVFYYGKTTLCCVRFYLETSFPDWEKASRSTSSSVIRL